MRLLSAAVSIVSIAAAAAAQMPPAPAVKAGDTWTYRTTTEKGPSGWNQSRDELTVSRVTSSSIYYSTKPSGSTQAAKESFSGIDWSRARAWAFPATPNLFGKGGISHRPEAAQRRMSRFSTRRARVP